MSEQGIPRHSRILDVGCGPGWLADRLQRAGYPDVAGADWLAPAEIKNQNLVHYRQVDFNAAGLSDYPAQSFDCVVCSDVLEHLENPAQMLREIARVVRPGGHVFVTIPNAFNIIERLKILFTGNSGRYKTEPPGSFGHITMLPDNVMKSLLRRAGLRQVAVGKGYCLAGGLFLFSGRRFSRRLSYVLNLYIRRVDARPVDIENPRGVEGLAQPAAPLSKTPQRM